MRNTMKNEGSSTGSALLDTLMGVTVLVVAILSVSGAALRSSALQQTTASYIRAHNTSRDVLEQLRNGDLEAQFQLFAATPDFDVGAQRVSVRFPEELLLETYGGAVPATARFRDVNSDGEVDLDVASTDSASLLPVRITVRQGALRLQLESLLTEM